MSGKRVLVAGCGGLGTACVRAFGEAGARVVVGDADEQRLREVDGPGVRVRKADLADSLGCSGLVDDATSELGGIDVLVHAIAINLRKPVLEIDDEDWQHMLTVNLSSAFWLGRAAGRTMVEQRYGRQVYFSSVSGLLAHPAHGPYAASKGGLNQIVRVMAREWATSGVTVNAVAPGYTETPLTSQHLEAPGVRDELTALVPAGRLGDIDDVVGPALFLASDRAGFVTGQVLYTDGGRTLV